MKKNENYTKVFGQSKIAKIIEFLILNQNQEFTHSRILKENNKLSTNFIKSTLAGYEAIGLIIRRETNRASYYHVDTTNELFKLMLKMYDF